MSMQVNNRQLLKNLELEAYGTPGVSPLPNVLDNKISPVIIANTPIKATRAIKFRTSAAASTIFTTLSTNKTTILGAVLSAKATAASAASDFQLSGVLRESNDGFTFACIERPTNDLMSDTIFVDYSNFPLELAPGTPITHVITAADANCEILGTIFIQEQPGFIN